MGFFILALYSIKNNVPIQTITTISVCSFLFSISQILDNLIINIYERNKVILDFVNSYGNFNLSKKHMLFLQKYNSKILESDRNQKLIKFFRSLFYAAAYAVLIIGLANPLNCFSNENLSVFFSLLSFSFIFVSLWILKDGQKQIQEWSDLQVFCELLNTEKNDINIDQEDHKNGQA